MLQGVIGRGATDPGTAAIPRRILVFSACFPSCVQPIYGVFVKERVRFVSHLPGVQLHVVAPVPYFPRFRWFKRWYMFSQIPREEVIDGLRVTRPRYFLPPRIGGYFHPSLMYRAALRGIESIRQGFDFDLIDSHFIYPNGVTAVRLGAHYRRPVVITCRGEDIERFPDMPLIGRQIRYALRNATQLVAVSDPIAKAMERHGADPRKITVIPNGVDCEKFRPLPQQQARREVGLPLGRPIVLAVGYRLELKGFHILVDAVNQIRTRFPDVLVVIVGGQARWAKDFLPVLEDRIRVNCVWDHVLIVGPKPQEELRHWYSAADLLAILSSREGSPNVLMEALACGLPAVATPVGGIPDILEDRRLGLLLPERTTDAAASGITAALCRTWDRHQIRSVIEGRNWEQTARHVGEVFDRAVCLYRSERRLGPETP